MVCTVRTIDIAMGRVHKTPPELSIAPFSQRFSSHLPDCRHGLERLVRMAYDCGGWASAELCPVLGILVNATSLGCVVKRAGEIAERSS